MYRAPVEEIAHTLKKIAGLDEAIAAGRFADLSDDLVDAILEEAGKFASRPAIFFNAVTRAARAKTCARIVKCLSLHTSWSAASDTSAHDRWFMVKMP